VLRGPLVGLRAVWRRLLYVSLLLFWKRERKAAEEAVPFLTHFSRGSCSIELEMSATFREYTNTVSLEGMPISFESACFLWSLCEATQPRRILDMGSGFSSFVFRRYQRNADVRPEVWSVDESQEWLEKTRKFLRLQDLSDDNLYTWEEFLELEPPHFDLIFHDLGYMHERPDIFERLLGLRRPQGFLVVDDFQNPVYRAEITHRLRQYDTLAGYCLRWLTLDKSLRYIMLVRQQNGGRSS